MFVFTCEDKLENMMCCIYDAWERALKVGHDNVRLQREPILQSSLFEDYIHVDLDMDKYEKVIRSIRNKISNQVYYYVCYAALSCEEDALDIIYRFLISGFKKGAQVLEDLGDPSVMRFFELKRKVANEAHFFKEFARFTSIDNKVYVCHLEPKSDIIEIVANHFMDRMGSEHWMIVDDNRHYAVVHPKCEDYYIKNLTDYEFEQLCRVENISDEYTDMWRAFFDAIAIKERENKRCQRNLMPIWYRKHMTEFM